MSALNLVILCLNTASYVINRNVRIHTQQKKKKSQSDWKNYFLKGFPSLCSFDTFIATSRTKYKAISYTCGSLSNFVSTVKPELIPTTCEDFDINIEYFEMCIILQVVLAICF